LPAFPPNLPERLARHLLRSFPAEEVRAAARLGSKNPGAYPTDPLGYANHILGVRLTPDQEQILRHPLIPPCRVDVPSGNDTGKTFVAAVAVCWWFDSFNPGVVYSTAPRYEHVVNVLWGQIRLLRQHAGLPSPFIGPRAPHLYEAPDHFAVGLTAARGESFQGRHIGRKLFVFDEATGLPPIYFETLRTTFDPEVGDACLIIYNPTDTTSQAYQEDMAAQESEGLVWHRFRLSALNHPNVLADLRGERRPIPQAVNLRMVNEWVRDWCDPVEDADDRRATDLEWPPSAVTGRPGKWYRPGPEFQARALGLWPDTGSGVWSDALWAACLDRPRPAFPRDSLPEIGCDTATGKGDDWHAIHSRWGSVSVAHSTSNTMDPARIGARLKEAARELAELANRHRDRSAQPIDPKHIPIKIDDATGNAVGSFLMADGYTVHLIGAGTSATRPDRYPRKRDELWFEVADRAGSGGVYLGALDRATLRRLKQQLMAPAWEMDAQGRRKVEPKDETKEKIGRSPDDADAFNLAYHEAPFMVPTVIEPERRAEYRGGPFGRGMEGRRDRER
jgi:hypothetical protein